MTRLTITRPDDWHVHLRDGASLALTVDDISRTFGRAIVMPNLKPPVTTTAMALEYRSRIIAHIPAGRMFDPLMTLYLTDNTPASEIAQAKASGVIHAVKLYPAGATTNSAEGLTSIEKAYPVLEALIEHNMPLLIHGEVTDSQIDIFDREAIFIDTVLIPLTKRYPQLKIVLEHITTQNAVQFVESASDKIAATITAHHLLYNRNHMLAGGIRPHFYCLPILKRNIHQDALLKAAVSGNPKFFLGTDSAPHAQYTKENACGCAGCYTAHAAIELYAEVFAGQDKLDKLEGFASFFGADFYGLPRHTQKITLVQHEWKVPSHLMMGEHRLVPLRASETIHWQVTP